MYFLPGDSVHGVGFIDNSWLSRGLPLLVSSLLEEFMDSFNSNNYCVVSVYIFILLERFYFYGLIRI